MIDNLIEIGLWPETLNLFSSAFLIFSSLFTSALTVAFGLGGGVVMLALLVHFLPLSVVIPIHGFIQLGSNSSRSFLLRHFIDWKIIVYFSIGAVVGALIGGQLVVSLPGNILLPILGVFILYTVWGPKFKKITANKFTYAVGGLLVTFATMFVGATGPLVMAFLPRDQLNAQQTSATHGMTMVIQHGLKIIIFSALGFQFFQWLIFLILMLIAGFVGAYFGRSLLKKMPEKIFKVGLNIVLTLLALRMILMPFL